MSGPAPDRPAEPYNATVVSLRRPHPELMVLRVRPDAGLLAFEPGQYATLGLGFWETRVEGCQEESDRQRQKGDRIARRPESFSHPILSEDGSRLLALREIDYHEFFVNLVRRSPEGVKPPELTPRLYHPEIREGSRIFCDEKVKGAYTLGLEDLYRGKHLIFASSGTGAAPHNVMIWQLLHIGYEGRITFLHCAPKRRDLAYAETHDRLQEMFSNFRAVHLTTEEISAAGDNRTVQEFVQSGALQNRIGGKLDPETVSFFLCGSDALIGVPRIDRDTRQKVYPRDPATGGEGLIEILETRYGFRADPMSKAAGERGDIHFEKWY